MIALYIIGGLIALILLLAALAGTRWSFQRSIHIQADPRLVWSHVNNFKEMTRWNPYIDRDPNVRQEITGTDGTVGATYAWDSALQQVGAGNQTITDISEGRRVASRINFIRPFKGKADAEVQVVGENGGSKVTWGIASSTPYPLNIIKLFGLIEKNMNRDFGKGLNLLKDICEGSRV